MRGNLRSSGQRRVSDVSPGVSEPRLLPATSGGFARDCGGNVHAFWLTSPDDAPRIVSRCHRRDRSKNSPYPTRTESEKEFARSFLAFLGNIKLFLSAICGAVTFTILLVSANTIAMAVRERTRETAILRTLGYTPPEILQLILGESVLISLMGRSGRTRARISAGKRPAGRRRRRIRIHRESNGEPARRLCCSWPPPSDCSRHWQQQAGIIASRKNVVESLRFNG